MIYHLTSWWERKGAISKGANGWGISNLFITGSDLEEIYQVSRNAHLSWYLRDRSTPEKPPSPFGLLLASHHVPKWRHDVSTHGMWTASFSRWTDGYLPGSEDAKNFLHRCRGSCASSSEDPRIGTKKRIRSGKIHGKLCSPNSRILRGVGFQWEKMASFLYISLKLNGQLAPCKTSKMCWQFWHNWEIPMILS